MARNQGRASSNVNWGICTNTSGKEDGTPCSKCQSKEKQAIRASKDFVCEECGEPLQKIDPPKTFPTKLIGIIAVAIVVVGGIVTAVCMLGKNPPVPLTMVLNKDQMQLIVGSSDTIVPIIQPADVSVSVNYTSCNESVVKVDSDGIVNATGKGETVIVVTALPEKGDMVADSVSVTVKAKPVTTSQQQQTNLGWATYSGPMKGGKPHGVGGTLKIKQYYSIDLKDGRGTMLEVNSGETIENTKFDNGRLRAGELHRNNGERKWFNC